jgi:predicted dinucleotide-binding enzyme
MRIGIIGAGSVGGTLGRRWAGLGHQVTFGIRHAAEGASAVKGAGPLPAGSSVALPLDAATNADVVVLATPWAAVPAVLEGIGPALDGKVLLDATNPLVAGLAIDPALAGRAEGGRGGPTISAAERIQSLVPRARVVKVFNTTGFDNMHNPIYPGGPLTMFYAGDDPAAKAIAHALAADLGFDPIDAGPLSRARELEHLALLWISLAFGGMGRGIGFRLERR